jgi:modulator of FtsH protease
MTSTTAETVVPLRRVDTSTLLGQTMGLVALTAALFAVGAYLGRNAPGGWAIVWFIAALTLLFGVNGAVRRSERLAVGLLLAFGLLLGLAVAPTIASYGGADPQTVWEAGGATALFIAAFGAAGYATRRDLAPIARYALRALIALIVGGIVLVFVQIPGGALVYAVLGLVVFAGLTLYDFQRLRQRGDVRTAPVLAASIFLDALNVFLLFLTIFSGDER